MEGGDFGGFDGFFGGEGSGRHRPTTAGERTVIVWLSKLASLLLMAVGIIGALMTDDSESIGGFLVIGGIGVLGFIVLWAARRFDLI